MAKVNNPVITKKQNNVVVKDHKHVDKSSKTLTENIRLPGIKDTIPAPKKKN
ncbi:MAG: hypothetical protein IPQ02_04005 [Saprospiraceae bacterium]|nr:hypothetical protein [Candidatus Defluviibacterium haderslevense]